MIYTVSTPPRTCSVRNLGPNTCKFCEPSFGSTTTTNWECLYPGREVEVSPDFRISYPYGKTELAFRYQYVAQVKE